MGPARPREQASALAAPGKARAACFRLLSKMRQAVSLHPSGEEVMQMITYSELFQFCLVLIGIIALFQSKRK